MSLSQQAVADYLATHHDFVQDWFIKNVGHDVLDSWTSQKKQETGAQVLQPVMGASPPSSSVAGNSITSDMFKDLVAGRKKSSNTDITRKKIVDLRSLSEKDLFMELIRDIANELDVNVLCHKILLNVSVLTKCDRGSLFLAKGTKDNRFLVSKLFDVTATSKIEEALHNEDNEFRVPFGKGIAGHVALSKEFVNIKNAYDDPRFNKEVDKRTGYRTHSILCMPILNYDETVIGVAQIINKIDGKHEFTEADEVVFRDYLTFCGIGLTNAQLFEMSVEEFKRNQLLLSLAKGIFSEQTNLDRVVHKIMFDAQDLLKCERCSVYLIDDSMTQDVVFSKVFNLYSNNIGEIKTPSDNELHDSKNAFLAKQIAMTNQILNIEDASTDVHFDGQVVDYDGFRTRTMLCVAIKNGEGKTIGVAQLMNKLNGKAFNDNDINVIQAFAIFCGLGIHNTQMYESAVKLMAKQSVALEVLSYHATAQQEETDKLKNAVIQTTPEYKLHTYEFADFDLTEDETCRATIRMFMDCDLINRFHVPYEVLCRWVLSVKKNYRPVTYHNWRHAFNVAQTMFTMCITGKMNKYLSHLEVFALIVACLCHDLDHRGTNNAFQSKVESPLAVLYGTSTMEHHHFDHCIMILNSEGNNIFQSLNSDDYREVIRMLEGAILSTDLALYFKKRSGFQELVDKGEKKWQEPQKKDLLRAMMMTACDVAAITKPWEIQKEIAALVAGEFFEQGDVERDQLNLEPMAMMDRQKKDDLPKMQVGFIDAICTPIYKLLSDPFPGMKPLLDGCLENRKQWHALSLKEDQTDYNPKEKKPVGKKSEKIAVPSKVKTNQKNGPIVSNGEMKSSRATTRSKEKSKTCILL